MLHVHAVKEVSDISPSRLVIPLACSLSLGDFEEEKQITVYISRGSAKLIPSHILDLAGHRDTPVD